MHEPTSTSAERERLKVYVDAYRDGHGDGFSNGWSDGYEAGKATFKQRVLDTFADDDELSEALAALLREN